MDHQTAGLAWAGAVALIGLAPLAKLLTVGHVLRAVLGAGSVPPRAVIWGLSLALTAVIMRPVVAETWAVFEADRDAWAAADAGDPQSVRALSERLGEPLRKFLSRNAGEADKRFLADLSAEAAARREPPDAAPAPGPEDWSVLPAAFLLTELRRAVVLGFLIALPFLAVDLLTAGVLHSAGVTSLPASAVSLPIKLLVFTLADGWPLLLRGLVLGYR